MAEWWESPTKKNYLERAQCIINQYGNYSFPELGLNVKFKLNSLQICLKKFNLELKKKKKIYIFQINGINTQGENIADNGGIKEAYRAYIKYATRSRAGFENWDQVEQRLPGLSQYNVRQLFWLGAANVWCQKSRPESLKLRILTGAHSPSRFRVRGPFANMPQFASDYNCPLGTAMNPVQKCAVW